MLLSSSFTFLISIGLPAAVSGLICITPTAPTELRALWSRLDSWYACAATSRYGRLYLLPYLRNNVTISVNFFASVSDVEFFTHFVVFRYLRSTVLPNAVPSRLFLMNSLASFRNSGEFFRNAHPIAPVVTSGRSSYACRPVNTFDHRSVVRLSLRVYGTMSAFTISRMSPGSRFSS